MKAPPQFPHQVEGVRWLLERHEAFALIGDEMRVGKTRQVIDAAQELYRRGKVDLVVVIAPTGPRLEWASPDATFGQIAQYTEVPVRVTEYRSGRSRTWAKQPGAEAILDFPAPPAPLDALEWIVTNYEFMRRKNRLAPLLRAADRRTILVLDESSAVANFRSLQSKACQELRAECGRVWLLNGTASGDDPEDVFGQFYVMNPEVIGCKYVSEFRARYAVMNPFITAKVPVKTAAGWRKLDVPVQVERWVNLDDLAARTAPHVIRRTVDQVFPDMPPRLPPSTLEVRLCKESWRVYRDMKKDAVAWLDANRSASAPQAGVKVMRLAQITSGFVGGVECELCTGSGIAYAGARADGINLPCELCGGLGALDPQAVGSEKLDAVTTWIRERLAERPDFKVVMWSRFRPEVARLIKELHAILPTRTLTGVQGKDELEAREETQRRIHPRTAGPGPLAVVGTAQTGAKGLNMAAASDMVYVSSDWSLLTRDQSSFRIVGPDQRRPATYLDVLASGPGGEQTIDHTVVKALREKRDVASMTADAWLTQLKVG